MPGTFLKPKNCPKQISGMSKTPAGSHTDLSNTKINTDSNHGEVLMAAYKEIERQILASIGQQDKLVARFHTDDCTEFKGKFDDMIQKKRAKHTHTQGAITRYLTLQKMH